MGFHCDMTLPSGLHFVLDRMPARDPVRWRVSMPELSLPGRQLGRRAQAACEDRWVDQAFSIDQALDAFVDDQRQRLSARTLANYKEVVDLLRHSLNGYGPNSLDEFDHRRWKKAYDAGDEDAFCHLLGPEHILEHFGEFLGYFMVHKVIAGQELLRSAGTVAKKLARWLHEHGYASADAAEAAAERSARAARDLPRAERLASLLYEQSRATADFDPARLTETDLVEDYLVIDRVERGNLYFAGGTGPVPISAQAAELAEPGWTVSITLARLGRTWKIVEVGNVYSN